MKAEIPKCEGWIRTATGIKFDLLKPSINMVCLEDIAQALSKTCRFGGHSSRFYSVAEHSVWMARLINSLDAPYALLHDASEAYIGDITRPLKQILGNQVKVIENRIQRTIYLHFGLTYQPDEIKTLDNRLLRSESVALMPDRGEGWDVSKLKPLNWWPSCWLPDRAYKEFMFEAERCKLK